MDKEKCIFCRIVNRKAPSHIVYEDNEHIAFLDIAPFSMGHTLVCPKRHGETLWDMTEEEIGKLFMVASRISKAVVKAVGAQGFRLVQNNGEAANQVVAHVHIHVIPVRMEDRERFLDRKKFTEEEMSETANIIKQAITNSDC